MIKRIIGLKNRFVKLSFVKKAIVIGLIGIVGFIAYTRFLNPQSPKTEYITSPVEKDTIIVSVSASGSISTANNASVTTSVSGIVSKVYVENNQTVKSGNPLAEIELSEVSKQSYTQALASYQNAKNSLENTKIALLTTQTTMFTNWDKFVILSENPQYTNSDGSPNHIARALAEYHIAENNWLSSEATYKNQQNVVNQAQTALNSAWLSLRQSSPTIYAPISGTVNGLSLLPGLVIAPQNADSSIKIANIITLINPTVTINLTEVDITKIEIGDKTTITVDTIPDKTFTGVVISIDTIGSVNSGVTNYPVVIQLDTQNDQLLPNMSVAANIITDVKNDTLLVPSTGVKSENGTSYVEIMVDGQPQNVAVETGLSSDTQTEILSGVNEGQEVITTTNTTSSNTTNGQSESPFSGFGNKGIGGGGAVRINR